MSLEDVNKHVYVCKFCNKSNIIYKKKLCTGCNVCLNEKICNGCDKFKPKTNEFFAWMNKEKGYLHSFSLHS